MTAYYNETDPYAAEWLRNLIAAGHIAPGDVDTRSIEDVHPDDLRPYAQCHFFAGIGVWSYALRRADWADDRPVWTGSCPCQPFSAAGKGAGFDDPRHLWPHWYWLIRELRPSIVIGEQVASKDAGPWIDLVQADMESLGHAFGAVPFPSSGVGAPHIRDRMYWVAHTPSQGPQGRQRSGQRAHAQRAAAERSGETGWMADTNCRAGREGRADIRGGIAGGNARPRSGPGSERTPCRLADPGLGRFGRTGLPAQRRQSGIGEPLTLQGSEADIHNSSVAARSRGGADAAEVGLPGPVNGFWRDADWLLCRDGRWRPVEPGTSPLVDGSAGRMGRVRADQARLAALVPRKDRGSRTGRLRGYGNAINAEAARIWIETVMECTP